MKQIISILEIVTSVIACFVGFLVLVSFFFAMYSSPVVVLNDTNEVITIEPIIVAQGDDTRRTFTPRLEIRPGETGSFVYDWDDSRFWGNVLLNTEGEPQSLCSATRDELDEEITVWVGMPFKLVPRKEKQVYRWSSFKPCDLYTRQGK